MNAPFFSQRFFACGLSALALLMLSSCASSVERRINRNPALFASLPAADKESVRGGNLREGMGKDAVFLALGQPDRISNGRKGGKNFERWTYIGRQTVTTQSFGMGYGGWGGWGGWGGRCGSIYNPYFMGGPTVSYVPYVAASVDFVDSKVAGWELTPKN